MSTSAWMCVLLMAGAGLAQEEGAREVELENPAGHRTALPYSLDFQTLERSFRGEDDLQVQALRGTKPVLELDGVYEISGARSLSSRDQAELRVLLKGGEVSGERPDDEPAARIDRGPGLFSLRFRVVREGSLALQLFPVGGGVTLGGIEIGTAGGGVLRQAMAGDLPGTLEELLRRALEANPDLQHARAMVEEADARRRQLEMALTRDLVSLYHERLRCDEVLKQRIDVQKEREQLHQAGAVSREEVRQAIIDRIEAESKLAAIDSSLRYMLGMGRSTFTTSVTTVSTAQLSLHRTVEMRLEGVPASDALEIVRKVAQVVIVVDPAVEKQLEQALSIDLGHLEAGQALQAIADVLGLECEERPYGIFLKARGASSRSRPGGGR